MSAERLRELLAEATPGPWIADPDLAEYDAGLHNVWHGDPEKPDLHAVAHDIFKFEDAELIALAPEAVALLVDMAEALTVARNQLAIDGYSDDPDYHALYEQISRPLARLDSLAPASAQESPPAAQESAR